MKAITIHEPWATLLSVGAKKYETREWKIDTSALASRWFAFHAGKNKSSLHLAQEEPFRTALASRGLSCTDFPLGCIVGIGYLEACHPTEGVRQAISAEEQAFGDFSDGRFAWEFSRVMRLPVPIAAKGAQGIWFWQPPAELMAKLRYHMQTQVTHS